MKSLYVFFMGIALTAVHSQSWAQAKQQSSSGVQATSSARYVKVSNEGKALPETAAFGYGAQDWGCVYDRTTKLMWEVKTNDNGLRDAIWTYTWYDSTQPEVSKGVKTDTRGRTQCYNKGNCHTEYFVKEVNKAGLCGFKDWRLPSQTHDIYDGRHLGELDGLINCSGGYSDNWIYYHYCLDAQKYKPNLLDQKFFINLERATQPNVGYANFSPYYWSNQVYDGNEKYTWFVNIETGGLTQGDQFQANHVLLVRNAPNFKDVVVEPPAPPVPPPTVSCKIPAGTTALCSEGGAVNFMFADASVKNGVICESYSTNNLAIAGKSFQCINGYWNIVGTDNSYCEISKSNFSNIYCSSKYVTNGFSCLTTNKEVYQCFGKNWILLK